MFGCMAPADEELAEEQPTDYLTELVRAMPLPSESVLTELRQALYPAHLSVPARCVAKPISHLTVKRALAETHYIGTPGATAKALGLYVDDRVLGGVATFGHVPGKNAAAICGPDHAGRVLELTRLALYEWLPTNAESWFLGQTFKWLEANCPEVALLISYADPYEGHCGTIYQATNWVYTGISNQPQVYETTNGETFHHRTVTQWKGAMPEGKWHRSTVKHRYVTFLGSPSQRRHLRGSLLWEVQPYPKGA
jgi:hypothetical protein